MEKHERLNTIQKLMKNYFIKILQQQQQFLHQQQFFITTPAREKERGGGILEWGGGLFADNTCRFSTFLIF
uniref:Uncharacterized protein n=1 Tax=Meloidogyne enterolobii TaxID=390850 RepID=A0A6V7UT01_MELEN|nr:unnamed protein product [Meloidogyne enterolobii]